jgi:hypothetical protein
MAMPEGPTNRPQQDDLSLAADGLSDAPEAYRRAQDELVEARNRLAHAIAGAAMSGLTNDEIVDLTGYPPDRVLRICRDAGIST